MVSGKKAVAERIVYGALDRVQARDGADPVETFDKALDAIAPMVEVKSRRVGGATYQVPVEVRPSRRNALAMRWLVDVRAHGAKSLWPPVWPVNSWTLLTDVAVLSRSAKTPTVWPKPTRLLLITATKREPHSKQQYVIWPALRLFTAIAI